MLTGKIFRMRKAVLAIETADNMHRIALTLPPGAIIRVKGGPKPMDQRLVDVQWLDRTVELFAIDIEQRGEEWSESARSVRQFSESPSF